MSRGLRGAILKLTLSRGGELPAPLCTQCTCTSTPNVLLRDAQTRHSSSHLLGTLGSWCRRREWSTAHRWTLAQDSGGRGRGGAWPPPQHGCQSGELDIIVSCTSPPTPLNVAIARKSFDSSYHF